MNARAILRVAVAVLLLLICLPLWALAHVYGGQRAWVRRFLWMVARLLGLRVAEMGEVLDAPVLLVANHISWLDILAIGGQVEVGFIAKSEIAGWPLVGWLARIGGSIFVARDRRSSTRDQADAVVGALHENRRVMLFAEGGTGDGSDVLPFRAPLFVSAIEAGVAVQPIAVDYGRERVRYAWPNGASFGRVAKLLLSQPGPVPVTLKFLAPLDARLVDRKELALETRDRIIEALDR